jgi:molybdate/tungstate transport system ATP-binding protein
MIETKARVQVGEFRLYAELQGGGAICLVGKNGTGKTTLLRAIAGFLPITEGFVRVAGTDVTESSAEERDVVLVTPATCFPHLSVDSHVLWGARLKGLRHEKGYVSKVKSGLGIDYGGTVGNLSRGMRQRVALATALLSAPRAILVDEAFLGLNDREPFISKYGDLAKQANIDLIFSSQDEADGKLADYVYVLSNGLTTPKQQEGNK